MRDQEVEDVEQEILAQVLARLRRLSERPQESTIGDFRSYVAVATYHACSEHLRSQADWLPAAEADELSAPDPGNIVSDLGRRDQLRALWGEIRRLPPRQCAALLLNLRDENGRDAVALFPLTGTATMRQIAAVLDIPAERFAELWSFLPLEDARIAELLGATRQQVINLRKAARARLTRRMKGLL
jgi:hypothetical protein